MTLQIFFRVSAVVMTTGGGKGDNGREEALKLSREGWFFGEQAAKNGRDGDERGEGKGKWGRERKKWGKCLEDMVFICIFAQ